MLSVDIGINKTDGQCFNLFGHAIGKGLAKGGLIEGSDHATIGRNALTRTDGELKGREQRLFDKRDPTP